MNFFIAAKAYHDRFMGGFPFLRCFFFTVTELTSFGLRSFVVFNFLAISTCKSSWKDSAEWLGFFLVCGSFTFLLHIETILKGFFYLFPVSKRYIVIG